MFLSVILVILSVVSLPLNTAATSSDGPVYKKVGDTVVLSPGLVTDPITYILWRHGPDIAIEWSNNHTEPYRQFKDRGLLNSLTGELTIKGLTRNDSGSYTSEINNRVTNKTQLLVISPVSKPTVSTRCEEGMTECVLTCDGNTTDAEPITFTWSSGDAVRLSSGREYSITKPTAGPWFGCTLQNPVSSESSEQVINPLFLLNQEMMPFMFLQSGAAILFIVFFVLDFIDDYTHVVIPGFWKILAFISGLQIAVILISVIASSIYIHNFKSTMETWDLIIFILGFISPLAMIVYMVLYIFEDKIGYKNLDVVILASFSLISLVSLILSSIYIHKYRSVLETWELIIFILGSISPLVMYLYIVLYIFEDKIGERNRKIFSFIMVLLFTLPMILSFISLIYSSTTETWELINFILSFISPLVMILYIVLHILRDKIGYRNLDVVILASFSLISLVSLIVSSIYIHKYRSVLETWELIIFIFGFISPLAMILYIVLYIFRFKIRYRFIVRNWKIFSFIIVLLFTLSVIPSVISLIYSSTTGTRAVGFFNSSSQSGNMIFFFMFKTFNDVRTIIRGKNAKMIREAIQNVLVLISVLLSAFVLIPCIVFSVFLQKYKRRTGIWEMSIYILGIPSLLLLIPCIVFLIYKYKRLERLEMNLTTANQNQPVDHQEEDPHDENQS